MAKAPLLTLDTLVERNTVVIDGKPYELRNPKELTLLEYHHIGRRSAELESMRATMGDRDPAEAEVQAVTTALEELCRLVLIAPAEVHARLLEQQKQAIIQAFMLPQRETAAPAAAPAQPTPPRRRRRSTGESTSPA
jgi:hypothetical protein